MVDVHWRCPPQIILMIILCTQVFDRSLCVTLCLGLAVDLDVMLHPGPAQHAETAVSSHYSCLCPFGCGLCLHLPETLCLLSACNELPLSLESFPGTERRKKCARG